jgi:hypothetical protein
MRVLLWSSVLALVVLFGCFNQTRTKSISSSAEEVCVSSHEETTHYTVMRDGYGGVQVPEQRSKTVKKCNKWVLRCKDGFALSANGKACGPTCSNDGDCIEGQRCLEGACNYAHDVPCEKASDCGGGHHCSEGLCEGGSEFPCENNSDCPSDYFCELSFPCRRQYPGKCHRRESVLCDPTDLRDYEWHDQVPGCDGKQYTKCGAWRAGISRSASQVYCNDDSDRIASNYCELDACGNILGKPEYKKGECKYKPLECPKSKEPFSLKRGKRTACDGQVYANECELRKAGASPMAY